jgi:PAS domain S-box
MVLIIIGITTTGLFVSQLTQKLYKQEVEQRLKTTAALIDHQLSERLLNKEKVDFNKEAESYAGILSHTSLLLSSDVKMEARITFIDFTGKVLGESNTDYHEMQNHMNRKEIQEAINGNTGVDIRFSQTLKMDFLYIAIPMSASKTVVRVAMPLVQLKKIDEIIWLYSGIAILAGFALTTLLALKFSSSLTRPVNELISASREISRGNYSMRVKVKQGDELGQLAGTFNDMATELEASMADLKDKNLKFDTIMNSMTNGFIAIDNTHRIILINAIACQFLGLTYEEGIIGKNLIEVIRNNQINSLFKQTVEKNTSSMYEINISVPEEKIFRIYANPIKSQENPDENSGAIISIMDITNVKKLEQIRTDFVSNVTHELKTPLTSIRGFVETLRGGAINDSEVADKFLEIIDIEAERLYMLINDILQLSEIETKQKDTNIGRYDLKSIVEDVISILQVTADKKNISISYEVEESLTIRANRDRIKQMLINLIDNAIKYNSENGSVFVKAIKAEGRTIIMVKDTGIGMERQHLPRIFERFYRVDKGRSRSMGGTGLGLSIVKHIVNLYNGDISVESEPGKGTEFTVQLPF